ncbi:uncharacterized protein LOC120330648 isoform X3 [Styela clava]
MTETCFKGQSKVELMEELVNCYVGTGICPFCTGVKGEDSFIKNHLKHCHIDNAVSFLNGKCGEVKGRQSWSAKSQNVDSKGKHINDEKNRHENNLEREYTHGMCTIKLFISLSLITCLTFFHQYYVKLDSLPHR